MISAYNTTELLISTILFIFIMGFIRTFLLHYDTTVSTIMYDGLFFFIWYGVALNMK